jgi:hypothetical protein
MVSEGLIAFKLKISRAKEAFALFKFGRDAWIDKKKVEDVIPFVVKFGLLAKDKVPALEKIYAKEFVR